MVFFILLVVVAFVVIGLLMPVRLRFAVRIDRFRPSFSVRFKVFYGLLPLRLSGFLALAPFGDTSLFLSVNGGAYKRVEIKPDEEKPPKKRGGTADTLVSAVLRSHTLDSFRVRGKLGVADDAYQTVLACGALRFLFGALAALLEAKEASADVAPYFGAPAFWLKVEGILTIHSTQIMIDALKRSLNKLRKKHQKGNQNVASH